MIAYEISLSAPLTYHWCGKFEAPNPKWMHLTRYLRDFELLVVTEGTLYIADHEREYTVRKGEYLLMAPTPWQHGWQSSDCMFYWLHFYPAAGISGEDYRRIDTEREEMALPDDAIAVPAGGALSAAERMIVLMKQLQDCDKRYHDRLINNYMTGSILCELRNQSALYKMGGPAERSRLYMDIVDYVAWHICENIRVSEIADYFGYNEKYLTTFFRRMVGMPLKQYILQAKMDHAKAELSDTCRTVSQVAYNNGFSDPHNFANAFKKVTGLTPTEYRMSYAKRQTFHQ